MVIPTVGQDLDHMVEVGVGHHLDHVEDIRALVEDGQDHVLRGALDQGKGTGVLTDVLEIEKGHGPGKSLDLGIENVKRPEIGEDQDLNLSLSLSLSLDVAQDLKVIKKIRNILLNEKKINQKNEKKRTKKKKIPHLLYQKLRKKINL